MKKENAVRSLVQVLAVLSIFIFTNMGFAEIPKLIHHEGQLSESDGTPLNGGVAIGFTIYDEDSRELWNEQQNVNVIDGAYSINLGDINPINLPFDKPYYLGITVGGDEEMTPRQPLTSVPYALNATLPVTLVNSSNYQDVVVKNNGFVHLEEVITLSEDYSGISRWNLRIYGGGFQGSGNEEVELGNRSRSETGSITVTGVTFTDVKIGGYNIAFRNCNFYGAIAFPENSTFTNCNFVNVEPNGFSQPIVIQNSTIQNSNISIDSVVNSRISGLTFGDENTNADIRAIGNEISSSKFYLGSDSIFSNNKCRHTFLKMLNKANGEIIISNNNFDNAPSDEHAIIEIQANNGSWRLFLISGNNFNLGGKGDKRAITVNGTNNGPWKRQLIKISGNNFLIGGLSIAYSGNIKTVVSDNSFYAIDFDLQTIDNLRVANNFEF